MYDAFRTYINELTSSIISDEEFCHWQDAFHEKKMKKRQFLLHEDSICKYMAFIVKGSMRQYYIDEKGVEHIVRFGIEGWWMSDRESFMMLTNSKYNIEALEDCDLLITTPEKLTRLRECSPKFSVLSHNLDSNSFIAAHHRIEATISYSAEEKYTHLMATYPEFIKRFPQNMLASYLGLTPETLSRVRKSVLSK